MDIKPFKALLPEKTLVEKIVCPPYDVVTRQQVKEIIAKNPFSFLKITRADGELDEKISEYSDEVYKKARENLISFIKNKILNFDTSPSFYLISQTYNGKTQNGIYCLLRCRDYENGVIKRHELTRKEKEEDRTRHIFVTKADTGPVFLFFKETKEYKKIILEIKKKEPLYSFKSEDEVKHNLWKISQFDEIILLQNYFKNIKNFYIADGHHRAASAVNVWKQMGKPSNSPYSYFMGVVFPSDELTIMPYNRVITDLGELSELDFIKKVKENFNLKETIDPFMVKKGEIGMFFGGKKYILKLKNKHQINNPLEQLDVSILHNYLLNPILGIKEPRTSDKIQFIGGKNATKIQTNIINERKAAIAFFLHPVKIEEIMEISDLNEVMPPKSTWFEPKIKDGLVTYIFEENLSISSQL